MKFGVGLFSLQTHPENPSSHAEIYRQALEQVKLAEEMGFDSVWLSEHHFLPNGYCPSMLATASAMAAVTNRIRIGTATLILPLHNPVRVAEDAAVVDNISNGRFMLGVALGYRQEEFDGFGIPFKQRTSRLEEGIDVVVKSWTEDNFSYEGKRYKFQNLNVTPKPVQKPHIPIYIGAIEEPAIRRAGRLGYPLLIGPLRTTQMLRDTLDIYNDAAKESGKNPGDIQHILLRRVYIAEDRKKAKEEAEKYITNMYRFFFNLGSRCPSVGSRLRVPMIRCSITWLKTALSSVTRRTV
ncbi:MAG TPA: LLM class flavin-dependent oxidoreductase [Thermodesulfobacteriota bacterium]|nr:LLM class flavin-dependent oxidoreductase [Thermodesulfobacteriota bacterium]